MPIQAAIPVSQAKVGLLCEFLYDGKSPCLRPQVGVVIEGTCIAAVKDKITSCQDPFFEGCSEVRSLSGTVLPGLIDCHVHPFIECDDYALVHLQRDSAYKALRGLRILQDMLYAGWTSVRIPGDADAGYGVLALQKCLKENLFIGPRVTAAAHYLTITGGGGDINTLSSEQRCCTSDGRVVNGPEEMRVAVREEIKYGSEWIKLLVSGAFMSSGDNPNCVHFSDEELEMALAEATRLDRPVMAHAHSALSIKKAVLAGVRSIEHGTFIDQEGIELMAKRSVWLVPTLYISSEAKEQFLSITHTS